jgi:Fe-Mn family superoxide dismutase
MDGAKCGGAPSGKIGDAIRLAFGGFDAFKEQWGKAGVGRFGSGWVWLLNEAASSPSSARRTRTTR